jgi:ribonucleotide monophosphatase NagD (HAD superfamily)
MATRPAVRAILIDLSGTLHIGSSALPGAAAALRLLRDAGVPLRFCSNTSKESTADLAAKLNAMGFGVKSKTIDTSDDEEVWTSLGGVKRLLGARGLKRYVYHCSLLGSSLTWMSPHRRLPPASP